MFFPTNEKEKVTNEETVTESTDTPVLGRYTVNWDSNKPGMSSSPEEETKKEKHLVYERVYKSWPEKETLSGWLFKGWKFVDPTPQTTKDIFKNDKNFVMPEGNVYLKGTWSQFNIEKSMKGEVYKPATAMFDTGTNVNVKMKELAGTDVNATLTGDDYNIQQVAYKSFSEKPENATTLVSTTYGNGVNYDGKFYMWYEAANANNGYKPNDKYYYKDDEVPVETVPITEGSIIDGTDGNRYRFLGWQVESPETLQINDVIENGIVTSRNFTMPNTDVVLIGMFEKLYKVSYEYSGDVPEGAAALLPEAAYHELSESVSVADPVNIEGYKFIGWRVQYGEVTITDGKFAMPGNDVVLEGMFEKLYNVEYKIEGDIPSDYTKPDTQSYTAETPVTVDALARGAEVNGYIFSGWSTEDATISNGTFSMPSKNVTIKGSFEKVYKVIYEFFGIVLPPNSSEYLPEKALYAPGDTVQKATGSISKDYTVTDENGWKYKFLGWNLISPISMQDQIFPFTMPEEDVLIQGKWTQITFKPEIKKEIIDKKEAYKIGETVEYKITVTNTANFAIKDVEIQENNEKAKFKAGEGYEVMEDQLAKIPEFSANSSITLFASYTVDDDDSGTIVNEVELVSASGENDEILKNEEYKAVSEFKVAESEPIPESETPKIEDIEKEEPETEKPEITKLEERTNDEEDNSSFVLEPSKEKSDSTGESNIVLYVIFGVILVSAAAMIFIVLNRKRKVK